MGKVMKKSHRSKGEKQVKQKKSLTNTRLTVPYCQNGIYGIFMKGKKSTTYHREENVRINNLNKARLDEKLNDILNLAKCSDTLQQRIIHDDTDDASDMQTFSPEDTNVVKGHLNDSSPMILKEKCEGKKYLISQRSEEITFTREKKKRVKQNACETQRLQSTGTKSENVNDSKYANFRLFITHFDYMFLDLAFTEDFIIREKLELQEKKRNKSDNQFPDVNKQEKTTTGLSQNPEGKGPKEENKTVKQINCKNINKIFKSKRNQNYNALKNIKMIQIVNTSHGQQKKHEQLMGRDIFQHHVPESPHREIHSVETVSSNKEEIIFPEINICKTKSSLFNPLSFLKNSLSENDNSSLPSIRAKSSLDGFQFLRDSLNLSSSSAPPELLSSKHGNDAKPFIELSQPWKSLSENSIEINKNFESPRIHKCSTSRHVWKNNLKPHPKLRARCKNIFEENFEEESKTCILSNDSQDSEFFRYYNITSNDYENCFLCSSQSHKTENPSTVIRKTDSNITSSSIYSKKSLKLESPVLENAVSFHDIKSPCCLDLPKCNCLTSKKTKNGTSSKSNFQEENRIWHRRKMF